MMGVEGMNLANKAINVMDSVWTSFSEASSSDREALAGLRESLQEALKHTKLFLPMVEEGLLTALSPRHPSVHERSTGFKWSVSLLCMACVAQWGRQQCPGGGSTGCLAAILQHCSATMLEMQRPWADMSDPHDVSVCQNAAMLVADADLCAKEVCARPNFAPCTQHMQRI